MMKMTRLLVLFCTCFFSLSVQAGTINKIIVFGDSLSDNGNIYALTNYAIPKNPPYFQGRFSNGPVWIESLARSMGFNVEIKDQFSVYAYAGAWGTDNPPSEEMALVNLAWEVSEYLGTEASQGIHPQSLIVLWIGSNDYLSGRYDADPEKSTSATVSSIQNSMEALIQYGAKHFLIVNLPDLGTTPKAYAQGAQFAARLSLLSRTHNQKLAAMLAKERILHPDVQILGFDLIPHFNDLLAHPEKYHLINLKDACYDGDYGSLDSSENKSYQLCNNPNEYIYWDHVHPSKTIHDNLANIILGFLKENKVEKI